MTGRNNVTFSSEVARLRKERGLLQSELGQEIKVSGDYISKIEAGNEFPADDTGQRLINFLSSDKEEKKRLKKLLEIATKQRGKNKPYQELGIILSDILKSVGMTQTDLKNGLKDTSIQAVHRIINGDIAPSPKLMQEIVQILKKRGAAPADIKSFRIARLKTAILNGPQYQHLTGTELKRLLESLNKILD